MHLTHTIKDLVWKLSGNHLPSIMHCTVMSRWGYVRKLAEKRWLELSDSQCEIFEKLSSGRDFRMSPEEFERRVKAQLQGSSLKLPQDKARIHHRVLRRYFKEKRPEEIAEIRGLIPEPIDVSETDFTEPEYDSSYSGEDSESWSSYDSGAEALSVTEE